ncbi:MAG: glycosyltransferase family 10 [Algisphaera sp.]
MTLLPTDLETPLRVKFVAKGHRGSDHAVWLRQFPDGVARWGRCVFVFDQAESNYDWLVAYDDLAPVGTERFSRRGETVPDQRRSIMLTSEPASVKLYGDAFLSQFGMVVTGHEEASLRHPHAVRTQPGLRWFYGLSFDPATQPHLSYNDIRDRSQPEKTGQISTVCSSKRMGHTLHRQRFDFTQALKERLPELDVFGHGVRPVNDKAQAIDPYRYHLCIENHLGAHHWTEKLSDPFLGYALPLYHGATEAERYFPAESFVRVGLDDPQQAAHQIQTLIAENAYEKRLPAILEARQRVLTQYGPFAVLSRVIESREAELQAAKEAAVPATIYSRHRFRRHHPWGAMGDWLRSQMYKRR